MRKTLFENSFFQDELPYDQVDFIGELSRIEITSWEFDKGFGWNIVHPIFRNGVPFTSVGEFRYKVNVVGYGDTYLYVRTTGNNPDVVLRDEVFYVKPFIQDKEDYLAKDSHQSGTETFNHTHGGVDIPHELVVDAYNRIEEGNFK